LTEGKPATLEQALRGFYQAAVGVWGIQPSEFWAMTPEEWWMLHEVKTAITRRPGSFTYEELNELEEWADEIGEQYRKL
jgi:tail assembly chaperone